MEELRKQEGSDGTGDQTQVGVDDGTMTSVFWVSNNSVERRPVDPEEDCSDHGEAKMRK